MTIHELAADPVVRAVGWALLHFVWQGAVIAVVVAGVLRLLARAAASIRYAVACCAMAAMLVLPVLTGMGVYVSSAAAAPVAAASGAASSGLELADALAVRPDGAGDAVGGVAPLSGWFSRTVGSGSFLGWVVVVWLAGVLALALRAVVGLRLVGTLRRSGAPVEPGWQRRVDELSDRLGISTAVRLLESARVQVPVVVGWLRPVILIPASALTGLTPRQFEAILVHELAHVRRHDYVINLLQVVVETLLFYNPAVWWISGRIREEREHCCDDAAVAATGEAAGYAHALVELEALRHAPPRLAMAAGGGTLLRRVRRLLGAPQPAPSAGAGLAGAIVLMVLAYGALLYSYSPVLGASPAAARALAGVDGRAGAALVSEAGTVLVVVEAGEHGIPLTGSIAAAIRTHAVTAVYTTSDRRTLDMARPLADWLGVPRISYDFGLSDPERFARTLLGPGGLERVPGGTAVLVLPRETIAAVLRHVAGTDVAYDLASNEILLIGAGGGEPSISRLRFD